MLQINTLNIRNTYRPYDLLGRTMLSADKTEKFSNACLLYTGSSGYLGPGARMRILE